MHTNRLKKHVFLHLCYFNSYNILISLFILAFYVAVIENISQGCSFYAIDTKHKNAKIVRSWNIIFHVYCIHIFNSSCSTCWPFRPKDVVEIQLEYIIVVFWVYYNSYYPERNGMNCRKVECSNWNKALRRWCVIRRIFLPLLSVLEEMWCMIWLCT